MMSKPELKPCPFCGGKAEIDTDYLGTYLGRCNDCGATGEQAYGRQGIDELKAIARKNWNTRANTTNREEE